VEERWRRGEEVDIEKVQLGWIGTGALVALPAASYYLQECKVAGTLQGIEMKDGEVHGQLHLLRTTSENLLKLHTANPDVVFRLHFCKSGCNQQEVADHLLHAKKWRQILDVEKEEGWVTNLEKVRPVEAVDEMNALRARGLALGEAGQEGEPDRDKEEKKERKKKKVKDTKKKRRRRRRSPILRRCPHRSHWMPVWMGRWPSRPARRIQTPFTKEQAWTQERRFVVVWRAEHAEPCAKNPRRAAAQRTAGVQAPRGGALAWERTRQCSSRPQR
jgi:hypothetical protein